MSKCTDTNETERSEKQSKYAETNNKQRNDKLWNDRRVEEILKNSAENDVFSTNADELKNIVIVVAVADIRRMKILFIRFWTHSLTQRYENRYRRDFNARQSYFATNVAATAITAESTIATTTTAKLSHRIWAQTNLQKKS